MLYSVVLAILLLFSLLENKKYVSRNMYAIVCFLILVVISACRFQNDSSSDFMRNYRQVIKTAYSSWKWILLQSEPIAWIFKKTVIDVFGDPIFFTAIISVFFLWVNFRFARKYAYDISLFVIMFFTVHNYFSVHNVIVQSLSMGFILLAFDYLINRKPIGFAALCTLGVLSHTAAFVFVPIYFLAKIKFTKKSLYVYLAIAFFCVLNIGDFFSVVQKYAYGNYSFSEGYGSGGANSLRLVLALCSAVLLIIFLYSIEIKDVQRMNANCGGKYRNRKKNVQRASTILPSSLNGVYFNSKQDEMINNCIAHGTLIYTICIILAVTTNLLFSRVSMFFSPFVILCADRGLRNTRNSRTRFIIYLGLLAFCIAWFIAMNSGGHYTPTPYTPFWEFPERLKRI